MMIINETYYKEYSELLKAMTEEEAGHFRSWKPLELAHDARAIEKENPEKANELYQRRSALKKAYHDIYEPWRPTGIFFGVYDTAGGNYGIIKMADEVKQT